MNHTDTPANTPSEESQQKWDSLMLKIISKIRKYQCPVFLTYLMIRKIIDDNGKYKPHPSLIRALTKGDWEEWIVDGDVFMWEKADETDRAYLNLRQEYQRIGKNYSYQILDEGLFETEISRYYGEWTIVEINYFAYYLIEKIMQSKMISVVCLFVVDEPDILQEWIKTKSQKHLNCLFREYTNYRNKQKNEHRKMG